MGTVDELLIARVGVNRCHHPVHDPERIVEHFDHWDEAVRRAARIRDDLMLFAIELFVIDAIHDGRIGTIGRGRHDHQPGTRFEVKGSLRPVGEEAGRLNYHVNAELGPWKILRIALLEHRERVSADLDAALGGLDRVRQHTEHRVVLEQVRHRVERPEVVHRHEVDVRAALLGSTEKVASNTAKTVDANAHRHIWVSFHRDNLRLTASLSAYSHHYLTVSTTGV